MRLYLDPNLIVYCVEGSPAMKSFCLQRLREVQTYPSGTLLASRLSRVEVLVKPMRLHDEGRTARFESFFGNFGVFVADVSNAIVDRALEIRTRSNLKLVDALHVATAIEHQASSSSRATRTSLRSDGSARWHSTGSQSNRRLEANLGRRGLASRLADLTE